MRTSFFVLRFRRTSQIAQCSRGGTQVPSPTILLKEARGGPPRQHPWVLAGARTLALLLALCLSLPHSALALRSEQKEDPAQLTGLKKALAQAIINPAPSATGLEEGLSLEEAAHRIKASPKGVVDLPKSGSWTGGRFMISAHEETYFLQALKQMTEGADYPRVILVVKGAEVLRVELPASVKIQVLIHQLQTAPSVSDRVEAAKALRDPELYRLPDQSYQLPEVEKAATALFEAASKDSSIRVHAQARDSINLWLRSVFQFFERPAGQEGPRYEVRLRRQEGQAGPAAGLEEDKSVGAVNWKVKETHHGHRGLSIYIPPEVGNLLRETRMKRGMGLTQTAAQAKISQPYLSLIEIGAKKWVSLQTLQHLEKALGLDLLLPKAANLTQPIENLLLSKQPPVEALTVPAFIHDPRYTRQVPQLDVEMTQVREVLTVRSAEPSKEAPTWTVHGYVHGEYAIDEALRKRIEEQPVKGVRFVIEALPLLSSLEEPALVFHQVSHSLGRTLPETVPKLELPAEIEEAVSRVSQFDPAVLAAAAFEPRLLPYVLNLRVEVRIFQDEEGYWVLAFFV